MKDYYNTVVQTSVQNREVHEKARRDTEERHQEKIKFAMNELYVKLTSIDYKDLIDTAAASGKFQCTLFEYNDSDTLEEFPYVFLFKGPRFFNLSYFDSINVVPVIKRLNEHFSPFELSFYRNKQRKTTQVNLKWSY